MKSSNLVLTVGLDIGTDQLRSYRTAPRRLDGTMCYYCHELKLREEQKQTVKDFRDFFEAYDSDL